MVDVEKLHETNTKSHSKVNDMKRLKTDTAMCDVTTMVKVLQGQDSREEQQDTKGQQRGSI